MRSVKIDDREFQLEGSEHDSYYNEAQNHINEMRVFIPKIETLPPGSTILDIGANIGLASIVLASYAPQCKIISIEPSPINYEYLKINVQNSGLNNIKTIQAAASNKRGILHFHVTESANWSGAWAHVVAQNHLNQGIDVIDVEAITLDDRFLSEPISFLKIDVEGHEPEVFAGAQKCIGVHRPLIYMEFNPWTLNAYGGHSPAAFAKALYERFNVTEREASDALGLVHITICRGTHADVFLELKEGAAVPSLEEMSYPSAALAELARLRATSPSS